MTHVRISRNRVACEVLAREERQLCRALTLLEMLVAIAIFAIAASIVAPMFSDDSRLRVMAASHIMISDIELAQVMTISLPNEPVIVRFDPENDQYWLAYAADPETPLLHENTGEPYLVTLGAGRASSAFGVTFSIANITGNVLAFDATGALTDFAATPTIHFVCGASDLTIAIAPMTGTISELADGEAPKPEDIEPVK